MPILSAQKPGRKSISKEEKKIKMRDRVRERRMRESGVCMRKCVGI
jgi:hypothetical protein